MGRYGYGSRYSRYDSPYYPPQPSVAERAASAREAAAMLIKKGQKLSPVVIEGRTIASTFWGKAWCHNLEAYSDYSNRLPRGRTYVRHGCVLDLKLEPGQILAQVQGSSLYRVRIGIAAVPDERWQGILRRCAGQIDSLVEMLQGKLPKAVIESVTSKGDGLFPSPGEIKLSCSCPDSAAMCKHVAAVLYGVGARLDREPELLFSLRQVDPAQLLAHAGETVAGGQDQALATEDLSALFGIELEQAAAPASEQPVPEKPATEKPAPKKPAVAKSAPATPVPKKPVPKKPAAKSAPAALAPKKPVLKKPALKKPVPKKPVPKKTAPKKPVAAKQTTSRSVVAKPAIETEIQRPAPTWSWNGAGSALPAARSKQDGRSRSGGK